VTWSWLGQYEFGDDGTFWICYEDFCRYYSTIYRCVDFPDTWSGKVVRSEWAGESAGGCPQFATCLNNPQFQLTVAQKTSVFLLLSQSDQRMESGRSEFDKAIGLLVMKAEKGKRVGRLTQEALIKMTAYSACRDMALEITLGPGSYSVIPTCFDAGAEASFTLSIWSDELIEDIPGVEELDLSEDIIVGETATEEEITGGMDLSSLQKEVPHKEPECAHMCIP